MTNHFSIPAFENLMKTMKRQKDRKLKYELPSLIGVQYVLGKGEGQLLIA